MRNALTIDVEEFFQVQALSKAIPIDSWDSFTPAIDTNTRRILDLLGERGISGTFFCLGWVAERNKSLIRAIHDQGHEVACHGYLHQLIYTQDPKTFREDVSKAKMILEDCIGEEVVGYRAPTYSITNSTLWALDILEDLNFIYDSSIFPIYHDNYGIPDAPRFPYRPQGHVIVEFPISTMKLGNINLPVSGGGYFRLLPYPVTRLALDRLEKSKEPFVFYIHPWEINADTPRIKGISALSRFRTYVGLSRTFDRLSCLIGDFPFTTMRGVLREYGLLNAPGSTGIQPEAVG